MTKFGDWPTNVDYPCKTGFFWVDPPGTAHATNTFTSFLMVSFPMPFTGQLIVSADIWMTIDAGLQQLNTYIDATASSPAPTTNPNFGWRSEGTTGSAHIAFTMPIRGHWASITTGTTVSVYGMTQNGLGAPQLYLSRVVGNWRAVPT